MRFAMRRKLTIWPAQGHKVSQTLGMTLIAVQNEGQTDAK